MYYSKLHIESYHDIIATNFFYAPKALQNLKSTDANKQTNTQTNKQIIITRRNIGIPFLISSKFCPYSGLGFPQTAASAAGSMSRTTAEWQSLAGSTRTGTRLPPSSLHSKERPKVPFRVKSRKETQRRLRFSPINTPRADIPSTNLHDA